MSRRAPYGKRFEDYLEAMYVLQREKKVVRVRDLARMLNVKPPTVVERLEKLASDGYVEYVKGEYVRLTDKGEREAARIYESHVMLREFLKRILMLPDEIAEADACYIEHGIHRETLNRLRMFLEFMNKYMDSLCSEAFLDKLRYYYEHGELPDDE